jgi:uncharacterized protein (TIGR02145 family)
MKKIVLIFLVNISVSAYINAQSVGINTDTPEASAVLDIVAPNSDKGVIAPRMTTLQRNSIVNPAEGLLVYDTDLKVYIYWNGTKWVVTMLDAEIASQKFSYFKFTGDTVVPTGSGAASIAEKVVAATSVVKQSAVPVAVLDAGSGGVRIDASGQYVIKTSAVVTNLAGGNNQALQAKIITYLNGVMLCEAYFHLPTSSSGAHKSSGKSYIIRDLNIGDIITVRLQKIIPDFSGNAGVTGNQMTGRFNNVILELDRLPYDCAGVAKCTVKSTLRPEGLTFMCYNLGANPNMTIAEQMAYTPSPNTVNSVDATVYGDLYQWGRIADGHQVRNSAEIVGPYTGPFDPNGQIPSSASSYYGKNIFGSGYDPYPYAWRVPHSDILWGYPKTVNDPCPVDWRLPTRNELMSIFNNSALLIPISTSWSAALSSGNRVRWSNTNTAGIEISADDGGSTSIFLPAAGYRSYQIGGGGTAQTGTSGYYNTGMPVTGSSSAYRINFHSNTLNPTTQNERVCGTSVRCIEDY